MNQPSHHSLPSRCLLTFFKKVGSTKIGRSLGDPLKLSNSRVHSFPSWLILVVIVSAISSGIPEGTAADSDGSGGAVCSKSRPEALWRDSQKPCESSFAYCIKGKKAPLPGTCPKTLVFNPLNEKCVKDSRKCQKDLTASSTTKKKGPQKESEDECPKKECGLYPGDECPSYYLCTGGIKVWKNCTGNNIFDVNSNECKDPQQGVCWKKISKMTGTGEKVMLTEKSLYCPFHNRTASDKAIPAETKSKGESTGVILASPQITNYGDWQGFVYCKPGSYFAGLQIWRRSTDADGGKHDHAGITSIGFACEFPLRPGESEVLGQYAPGSPDKKWFNFLRCELGTTIGFQLSQQPEQGPTKDDLATDNVRVFCSCGKNLVLTKRYHEPRPEYIKVGGHRGNWTDELICGRKQALCGFQTQMQPWKKKQQIDYDKGDMTGLNQMKVKCCDVPAPGDCIPEETRHFLETCDNLESEYHRDCSFEAIVGIDYNQTKEVMQSVSFYESIGHTVEDSLEIVHQSFKSNPVTCATFPKSTECAFQWGSNMNDDLVSKFFRRGEIETGETAVKAGIKAHIYQVVASCGIFTVYTNQIIKVRVNAEGQLLKKEIFESF
ncbi:unnamed protein product [Orchesella dallaii]|uniref:Chitin-binding type-2 domain-containing protein n=1 Tax=Orchesella dallaii TaxID=48710 RepID=A0ABP1Q0R3_9HEXA